MCSISRIFDSWRIYINTNINTVLGHSALISSIQKHSYSIADNQNFSSDIYTEMVLPITIDFCHFKPIYNDGDDGGDASGDNDNDNNDYDVDKKHPQTEKSTHGICFPAEF